MRCMRYRYRYRQRHVYVGRHIGMGRCGLDVHISIYISTYVISI